MDMQELLSKLPEYARRPCELLMEGRTIDETAQLVGMKRITFYRQIFQEQENRRDPAPPQGGYSTSGVL